MLKEKVYNLLLLLDTISLFTCDGKALPFLKAIRPFSAKTYLYFSKRFPPPNCS